MIGAAISSEAEKNKMSRIVGQIKGFALADFAYADVDRLNSFYRTVKKNGRCFAVSLRQAYMLKALHKDKHLKVPSLGDESILIFQKSKKRYPKWDKQIVEKHSNKIVDVFEVSKRQREIVLAMSFYDLKEFVEINSKADSCYVLSDSEPFSEDGDSL